VVPTTVTVADATGSVEPSSVTRPVMRRVCADALALNSANAKSDMTNERVVLTRLSIGGWSKGTLSGLSGATKRSTGREVGFRPVVSGACRYGSCTAVSIESQRCVRVL